MKTFTQHITEGSLSLTDAHADGYTQRDPSDIREWRVKSINKESLITHVAKHGFKPGDTIITLTGTLELYVSRSELCYSWRPNVGRPVDTVIKHGMKFTRLPTRWRNPTFHSQTVVVA